MRLTLFLIMWAVLHSVVQASPVEGIYPDSAAADSVPPGSQTLNLETYEDNFIGITNDSDDDPFMDFTLSVVYRLEPLEFVSSCLGQDIHFFFAFSGRFAQYIGNRSSSPVVGKRFNPYLFAEYTPLSHRNMKFELGYAHESNGQVIDDSATFFSKSSNPKDFHDNIDYISRGWDYVGLSWKNVWHQTSFDGRSDISLRYFLKHGVMQGDKEEYRSWEKGWDGEHLRRNEVNGITASMEYFPESKIVRKIKGSYETGISAPLKKHSIKVLIRCDVVSLPFTLQYANGYGGDLAQFGKRNSSFSVSLLLSSFDKPW